MAIVKDEKHNRWYISYHLKLESGGYKTRNIKTDENGLPWPIHGNGRVTRSYMVSIEATEVARDMKTANCTINHKGAVLSLEELVSAFEANCRANSLDSSTIEQYLTTFKVNLYPLINPKANCEEAFKVAKIDDYRSSLVSAGYKGRTINNKLNALKKLIVFARKRRHISLTMAEDALDLLDSVKEADGDTKQSNFLYNPREDAERLFSTFDTEDQEWKIPFLTMFYGALRAGEFCGLKVCDCDFAKNTIIVRRQIDPHGDEKPYTKNKKALPVHLPADFMEQLHQYVTANGIGDDEYLFQSCNGKPMSRTSIRRVLDRHLQMAGIPHITLHGLRHSFASYMFSQGFDVKQVQAQCRHTNMGTTMDYYIHLTQNQENELMNSLSISAKK